MFSSQSQMASGLMRLRSAPSSFLENLVGGSGDEFHQPPPVPQENLMGRMFSGESSSLTSESSCRVAVSTGRPDLAEMDPSRSIHDLRYAPTSTNQDLRKGEGFATGGFSEQESVLQRVRNGGDGGGFSHLGHVGMRHFTTPTHDKSSLTRHTSSPAGFLANLHLENGYSFDGEVGNFSLDNCSSGVAQRKLKSQLNFSGHHSPKGRLMSQLSDVSSMAEVGESMAAAGNRSSGDGILGGTANADKSFHTTGFPLSTTWDDANPIVFGVTGSRKRGRDLNGGDLVHGFTDHQQFGLSKASLETVSMEKFLQIPQDSVPCKIRAKRGCATHPRSIAERERRTRISEKLRKLQELVPNMDKQTNTADMLDLAVQYIKTLQNDAQRLSKERDNCTCARRQDAKS